MSTLAIANLPFFRTIIEEHEFVKSTYLKFQGARSQPMAKELAFSVIEAVLVHDQLERDVLYPEFERLAPKHLDLLQQAFADHNHVKDNILKLSKLWGTPEFEDLFHFTIGALSQHMGEEEHMFFPAMLGFMETSRLQALEQTWLSKKQSLIAQIRTALPNAPQLLA